MQSRLTEIEKSHFCAIIRVGCDRATGCMRLGITEAQLRIELALDEEFARSIRRSAAEIELEHMQNLRKASEDQRHWRASQWWLERRAPQRYAARGVGAISAEDVDSLCDRLTDVVVRTVTPPELAAQVIAGIEHAKAALDQAGGLTEGDAASVDQAERPDRSGPQAG